MNTRLNTELIKNICSLFPQPRADVIKATGIKPSTFYDMRKNIEDITIEQILAISNGLHIPVRRLFVTGKEIVVGKKEDYVVEPFVTCRFDEKGIEDYISLHREATWKDASEAAGMTYQGLRESMSSGRRFPVSRFLAVCVRLKIDPFSVIIDPNPAPKSRKRNTTAPFGSPEGKEISALKKDVDTLEANVADLTAKYEELLKKHEELMRRVQVNIDTISNSYVNTIGIAAEER